MEDLELEILSLVDSTNRHLKLKPDEGFSVVLAEKQSGGRGRRGRQWVSTPDQNILMSVAWKSHRKFNEIGGLSLAAGVAVVDALGECGINGVGLKWPNDLMVGEAKLGGILIEVEHTDPGNLRVIMGLGLNIILSDEDHALLPNQSIDLLQHTGSLVDRNQLSAHLISRFRDMSVQFECTGFAGFKDRWESVHTFKDRLVTLSTPSHSVAGRARGVDYLGKLQLETESGNLTVWDFGEVSLRA